MKGEYHEVRRGARDPAGDLRVPRWFAEIESRLILLSQTGVVLIRWIPHVAALAGTSLTSYLHECTILRGCFGRNAAGSWC